MISKVDVAWPLQTSLPIDWFPHRKTSRASNGCAPHFALSALLMSRYYGLSQPTLK